MTEKEFKQFYHKNIDSLRNYLYFRSGDLELSIDLAQDSFLTIWEKQVENEGKKTVGLLFKIASDLFVSSYRKSKVQSRYIQTLKFEFDGNNPEKEMQYSELKEKYEQTLTGMGEKQRVVFLMSRMEGLKNREIAEKLGISIKAVEKRMKGAISVFREVLKGIYYLIFFFIATESMLRMINPMKTFE